MKRKPPYRDGKVHVCEVKCATCIFRPGNLMRLAPGRVKEVVEGNLDVESALTCHDTLPYGEHPERGEAICRGFFDSYKDQSQVLQLAERFDIIEFVPDP